MASVGDYEFTVTVRGDDGQTATATTLTTVGTSSAPPAVVEHVDDVSPQLPSEVRVGVFGNTQGSRGECGGNAYVSIFMASYKEGSAPANFPVRPDQLLYRLDVEETTMDSSDPTLPSSVFESICDPGAGCVLTEGNEFVYVAVYSGEQVLLNRFANKLQGCIGNSSCSTLGVPGDVVAIASNPFLVDPVPKSGRLDVDPDTGDGLVTDFLLKQTSWVDNSPAEDLEYKFSVFDRKTGRTQVLRAWDSSPQLSPVYLAASDYMVIGYVRDAAGSVTSARTNITVNSVQVSTEDIANLMDQQIASSDPDAIMNVVASIANSDAAADPSVAADPEKAAELSEKLLGAVSSALAVQTFDNPEDVAKFASSVSSLSSSPTMSADNIDATSALLSSTIDNLPADAPLSADVAGDLLGAVSSVDDQ